MLCIYFIIKGRGYIFIILKKQVMVGVGNKGYIYCDYLKFNSYLGIKKERLKEKMDKLR